MSEKVKKPKKERADQYLTAREKRLKKKAREEKKLQDLPVKIEVKNDYNGVFERAVRETLAKGVKAKKTIRPKTIVIDPAPFRGQALHYEYDEKDDTKLILEFSSTSRQDGQLWDACDYLASVVFFVAKPKPEKKEEAEPEKKDEDKPEPEKKDDKVSE